MQLNGSTAASRFADSPELEARGGSDGPSSPSVGVIAAGAGRAEGGGANVGGAPSASGTGVDVLTGSNYGAPLESGSNVGDALISTDASDGWVLPPMTSASVAGTSVGEDDGVSVSAGGTNVDVSVGADVVSAGRDHGSSCDSREPSALVDSSRRLHAVKEDASKPAVPTSPPVDDMFLSQMEPEYSWLSSALGSGDRGSGTVTCDAPTKSAARRADEVELLRACPLQQQKELQHR